VSVVECSQDGCGRELVAKGFCYTHYQRMRNGTPMGPPIRPPRPAYKCSYVSCDVQIARNASCPLHSRKALAAAAWSEGRWTRLGTKEKGGYVRLQRVRNGGTVEKKYEHRHVVEQDIGRMLLDTENIHHINGVRDDNRIENLELWSTAQPAGQRIPDKVQWAKELLALYEPSALAQAA